MGLPIVVEAGIHFCWCLQSTFTNSIPALRLSLIETGDIVNFMGCSDNGDIIRCRLMIIIRLKTKIPIQVMFSSRLLVWVCAVGISWTPSWEFALAMARAAQTAATNCLPSSPLCVTLTKPINAQTATLGIAGVVRQTAFLVTAPPDLQLLPTLTADKTPRQSVAIALWNAPAIMSLGWYFSMRMLQIEPSLSSFG